ncbi:MAG: TspO/MBR family protein [Candidatus Komeilibacteria bacterium]
MKWSYIIIVALVLLMSVSGSLITNGGMNWYDSINLPTFTPPGSVIGGVWTIIFILFAIISILMWRQGKSAWRRRISCLFIMNAILNIGWSAVFFGWHQIGWAVVVAVLLEISVLSLIISMWSRLHYWTILLWPYAAWVLFATYLTYRVWLLNV